VEPAVSRVHEFTIHFPAPDGQLWPADTFAHRLGTAVALTDPDGAPVIGVIVEIEPVNAGLALEITIVVAELTLTPTRPHPERILL